MRLTQLAERQRVKLCDKALNRDALVDIATVLLLLAGSMRPILEQCRGLQGAEHQVDTAFGALATTRTDLLWISGNESASEKTIRQRLWTAGETVQSTFDVIQTCCRS